MPLNIGTERFRYLEPYIFGEEYKNIKECLDTNWISSQGKFVSRFEEDFSKYISRKIINSK